MGFRLQRYLSLGDLYAAVRDRAERATARTVETKALRVEASRDDAERLALVLPGRDEPIAPTHWSFGQLCSLVAAPAGYLRQLPAALAGINMQHGLLSHRAELVKSKRKPMPTVDRIGSQAVLASTAFLQFHAWTAR